MAILKIERLRKRFNEVQALDDVSFEFDHGILSFLGPSGCGKTTLLRSIAGLEVPDGGSISIADQVQTSIEQGILVPPYAREIGFVFQNYALWPHMTVFKNVAFGLKLRKLPADEVRRKVLNALELVGLQGKEERYPSQLSGGQQQRVALARSLALEPRLILLDEPLSNLDAKLREQMRFELKALQESFGITTVYVTHDQEEALALSDRIGLMHEGALIEIGSPAELYLRPAHRVTADFLGTANFIPAEVQRDGSGPWDGMLLATPLGSFGAQRSVEWQQGMTAQLFFRPESVEFLDEAVATADNARNHCTGFIERVTFLGSSADVIIRCSDLKVRARTHPARAPAVGQAVRFRVAQSSCIVFPSRTMNS